MNTWKLLAIVAILSLALTACGGGGSSSSSSSSSNNGSGGTTVNNVTPLVVDAGPASLAAAGFADADLAFATVTICVPGTSSCQTIDHVQVDTGSEGLRLLSSVVTLSLPQQTSGASQVSECVQFGDMTFTWGTVASADIQISGETAKNVPIQLINGSTAPTTCSKTNTQISDVKGLGANGILGLGLFREDCGGGCALAASSASNPGFYYGCAGTTCNVISEPLASQLQNPVWMFPSDNNGVIIKLPAISTSSGQTIATGSLIFGIGTQSDNAVGSAVALMPDPSTGNFAAQFNNVTYNDFNGSGTGHGSSFIDSGSNGFFFLDATTLNAAGKNFQDCTPGTNNNLKGFYCPTSTQSISVNVIGESSSGIPTGSARTIQFSIANAQTLFSNGNAAYNNVGGAMSNGFDFGLPFFFGQNVYFVIQAQSSTLGTGPLYAF